MNRELRPWQSNGPRRAGVSAFGVGGVNSHVVLEEPPAPAVSTPSSRSAQLLCLSARSQAALHSSIENLARSLQSQPELPLEDVAYTLAVGRKAFDFRATFVCAGVEDAIAKLQSAAAQTSRAVSSKRPEVVFLFRGRGRSLQGWEFVICNRTPLSTAG